MSQHFNRLTPQEAEALALLAEECGEVVQAIGKILRHGLSSVHPLDVGDANPDDNRARLENEIGDVAASVDILRRLGVIQQRHVDSAAARKLAKVGKYLHHIALP